MKFLKVLSVKTGESSSSPEIESSSSSSEESSISSSSSSPQPEVESSSSSSSSQQIQAVTVSGAGDSDCNGVYTLVSETHGTRESVYEKSGYRIEYVSNRWYIKGEWGGGYAYYGSIDDAENPWSTTYNVMDGIGVNPLSPAPTVTEGSQVPSSSSSSSSEEMQSSSESSSESSSVPSVTVSGAGDTAANGTYMLVSGTHEDNDARYEMGDYYIYYENVVSKWGIYKTDTGLLYDSDTLYGTYGIMPDGTSPAPTVEGGSNA